MTTAMNGSLTGVADKMSPARRPLHKLWHTDQVPEVLKTTSVWLDVQNTKPVRLRMS